MTTLAPPQPALRDKALRVLNQLPPFSPTLNKLLATLAQEDVFFGQVAGIIEKDTVLAGHVLKLVNSALYARSGTISSVRHAISILGLNKLRNTALSLSVARMWRQLRPPAGWSQSAFNRHAVATAVAGDLLAQHLPVHYAEGAFTAGLLHAIGKMLIAVGLPEHYTAVVQALNQDPGAPIEEIEVRIIGCHHAELAELALAHWKLPAEIQAAVGSQHNPNMDPHVEFSLSRLLRATHILVTALGHDLPTCRHHEPPSAEQALADLGLGGKAESLLAEFEAEFSAMAGFF